MRRLAWVALLLLTGCANVTTMVIKHQPDGTLDVSSGKDVHAKVLDFREGAAVLHIEGYSSDANTAAIDAQAAREIGMTNAVADAVLKALQAGAGLAAKGAGVP